MKPFMKNINQLSCIVICAALAASSCCPKVAPAVQQQPEVKKQIVRGEQAPPATPGQRNFGGMIPPAGTQGQTRPQRPPAMPAPEI